MEKQIIIIYPYRFREFDRKRLEVEYLKQYTDIVIHDLIDILHPHFSSAYHVFDGSSDVIRFSNLLEWRREYLKIFKSFKGKTYVLNFVPVTTFKEFFVNYILSSTGAFLIRYDNPGVVTGNETTGGFFSKIRKKYLFIIKRASFKWWTVVIGSRVLKFFNLLFCRKSDVILSVDTKNNKASKRIISTNSFDYSMVMGKNRGNKFETNIKGDIIYLDTGYPLFSADDLMYGYRTPITADKWYPALVNLFNIIENKTGNKVVIAAHPKHQYSLENKHYFGNRKIFHGKTQDIVSHASLVLNTYSTSVSYAIMFNKPVLVLLSDELIENNTDLLYDTKAHASMLGCPTINIDKIDENLFNNFSVNSEKYLAYKNKYLSSRLDHKTNGEIFISEILNEELDVNNVMKKHDLH
jgi:hypothetical protein